MSLGGLWHGANWNYVLWGLLAGVLLVVHRAFAAWAGRRPTLAAVLESAAGTAGRIALTFGTFVLSLVVFRSPSLASAGTMLGHLFGGGAGSDLPSPWAGFWLTAALVFVGHALGALLARERFAIRRWGRVVPAPAFGAAAAAPLTAALVLAPGTSKAFIYFQF